MKMNIRVPAFRFVLLIATILLLCSLVMGQRPGPQPTVQGTVKFDQALRDWDGFGVNYVELCNIRDLKEYKTTYPQEYGGYSTLSEAKRQEIQDMIFGTDGVKPGLVKMFLDPFHEGLTIAEKGKFDHETTTKWMRYFVGDGLKKTRAQGNDLQIVTTMYGPPAWGTKTKLLRGRDLDPEQKEDVAAYMIDWAKWLITHEGYPVKAISLHNEGEGYNRWPADGSGQGLQVSMDYDLWWPTSQVLDFMHFMRPMMDKAGLKDVALTPGETSNWAAFASSGYAYYLATDPVAIKNLGLVTSHGFGIGPQSMTSAGIDAIREKRPDMHAWNTSMTFVAGRRTGLDQTWGDNAYLEMIRQNIYSAKVNGIIPWSIVQSDAWEEGDPRNTNWGAWVGTGFWLDRKGGYTIDPGFYLYKQVSRAGQAGMSVVEASTTEPNVGVMAFGKHGTKNPDSFVINNLAAERNVSIKVSGTTATTFDVFVTDLPKHKYYRSIGTVSLKDGVLAYAIPAQSVVTFFAKN
jgi:hypothetical protein